MKSKTFLLILTLLLFVGITPAAVIQIAAGTDVLKPAIDGATAGDVIELTTDGGIYAESAKMSISKNITIRAKDGLANKPVIRCAEADYMFKVNESNVKVTFDGVEIDGSNGTGSAVSKYFLRLDTGDSTGTMVVKVLNSIVHHFTDKAIKPYALTGIDSLVVDNSIFYGGSREGIVLYTGTSADPAVHVRYASFTNSTFHTFVREAIKGQTFDSTEVIIDRCTFYDLGGPDKAMLYFRNMTDVVVKNSIFMKMASPDDKFADLGLSENLITNCAVWDVANWGTNNATVGDTIHADPLFSDAANGDFTVNNPDLYTYADDFGPIGDPRWISEPTLIQLAAGNDVLKAAIDAADANDIIELTTDGGVYAESAKMSISKNITIRAKDGLANKPVIRCAEADYMFKVNESNVKVTFDGVEIDGSNGTGSAVSKYFLRLDTGDSTGTMVVKVLNSVAHDFTDKVIKPYALTGIELLKVDNSIFYGGSREGIVLYTGTSSDPAVYIRNAEFTNNTFYNFAREAIKGQTYPYTKVLIDRNTFYNLGGSDKAMLYFRNMTDVVVINSIFMKMASPDDKFADLGLSGNLITNCAVWDVANWGTGNATLGDTVHADPLFTDAANGDFTVNNQDFYTYADDGGAIGDPRWIPLIGKVTLKVAIDGNGEVTLDPAGGIYDPGTQVTLTAVPGLMFAFDHWDGVVVFPPNTPTATVVVNENMTVKAYFVPTIEKREVTVNTIGIGHVDVVEYSDYDVEGYYEGDSLVFTPMPDSTTWEFAYWVDANGDSLTNVTPLSYVVTVDTVFTALFRSTLPQVAFNLTVEGLGDVSVSPKPVEGFETYDQGTVLTLIAKELIGWEFASWSGGVTDTKDTVTVTLNADTDVTATFTEIAVTDGELIVDDSWDLRYAIEFVKNNSQAELIKLVSVGPFMPEEADRSSGKLPQLNIEAPTKIVGADTLATKPVIKGWGEGGSEGLFRLRSDGHLVLENLEIDGYFTADKKTKYIFRLDDGDSIDVSVKADNVDFHGTTEVFLKFYALVHADTLRFTNCSVWDIGKEGIFDNAAGTSDYIELKNSTFHHVGREILRLKAQTPTVVIDHVTVDSCGYGYGTEGDKFAAFKVENANEISITNSIISNVPNTIYGYSIRFYGEESMMDNTLLYNASRIDDNDGSILGPDIYWYDPMFLDAANNDYTLKDSSVAYHLVNDGSAAIGDLRWATSANIATYHALDLIVEGSGEVTVSPEPMAKFYVPATVVNLTAVPDSLAEFLGWSGDVTGTELTTSVTMDANKAVTATFNEPEYGAKFCVNMRIQILKGNFDPAKDTVDVAGGFGHMGAKEIILSDEDADSIYCMELKFKKMSTNRKAKFRFRINGVPEERGGVEKSVADREVEVSGADREVEVNSDTTFVFWYNDEEYIVLVIAEAIPTRYELRQNYPNPFNPTTTIQFSLKKDGFTTLMVYDMLGREVARLVNKDMKAGYHQVVFSDMARLASGVYIYQIKSGNFVSVKKMILMK